MNLEVRTPKRYRQMAAAVRDLAVHVSNEGDRIFLLAMARDYDAKCLESEKARREDECLQNSASRLEGIPDG